MSKVRIVETYKDTTHIFWFGRIYDIPNEGMVEVMVEGGFAEIVKPKPLKVETAEANPHKTKRGKAKDASDNS